jgi:hypothetical protein
MARSLITSTGTSLQDDSGGVLWSIVQGEQLEFPVTLDFIANVSGLGNSGGNPYTFEAVVMEAENVVGQIVPPVTAKAVARIDTTLDVWHPTINAAGLVWIGSTIYTALELVRAPANNLYYKRKSIGNLTSIVAPELDAINWELYEPNQVHIQFPLALSSTWAVQPNTQYNTYGFFELRVTEPTGGRYQRTWKPMRGMVEMLYSPTNIVPVP